MDAPSAPKRYGSVADSALLRPTALIGGLRHGRSHRRLIAHHGRTYNAGERGTARVPPRRPHMRDYLLETILGEPINLRHALSTPNRPVLELKEPKRTICSASVVRWDHWFWRLTESDASHRVLRDLLVRYAPLTETVTYPEHSALLRQIEGLDNMYESETYYADLDALATAQGPFGDRKTPAPTQENLHELLVRARLDEGDFEMRLWDGRLFWKNKANAQTVAEARWMASALGEKVMLKPRPLSAVGFCRPKLLALLGDWDLFAVRDLSVGRSVTNPVKHLTRQIFFHGVPSYAEQTRGTPSIESCLDAYGLTHFEVALPQDFQPPYQPYDEQKRERILFLRKQQGLAARAAEAMRAARIFDLGAHLLELCERQEKGVAHITQRSKPEAFLQVHA